jgi:monofunctional biosynthetic peptidoglycan transglycosylase
MVQAAAWGLQDQAARDVVRSSGTPIPCGSQFRRITVCRIPGSFAGYSASVTARQGTRTGHWAKGSFLRSFVRWLGLVVVGLWLLAVLTLVAARWIDPPTTAVQMERRMQAWVHGTSYQKRYEFVPLNEISPNLQHAVIAAEDARFYQHHGFDWQATKIAAEDDLEGGRRIRGGSTLTQQLVKNLFFGTGRSLLRKGAELTLVPVAELVLGKRRILELYLNVVEWGRGVYGAEAGCRSHYKIGAQSVGREDGARLAAILPAPLKRRPERMNHYSELILERMHEMGW